LGQTLWSLTMAYHTTIKDIQALNGLADTNIREGQKLLVRKNAAQPVLTAKPRGTSVGGETLPAPSHFAVAVATPTSRREPEWQEQGNSVVVFLGVGIAGLVLAGMFFGMLRKGHKVEEQ
jgi:LysM repeat protein